ncbi:hypothetical protein EON64_16625 [archaeon]|nr:MAG: hypothetical protein EON64_16625 [archaeon]
MDSIFDALGLPGRGERGQLGILLSPGERRDGGFFSRGCVDSEVHYALPSMRPSGWCWGCCVCYFLFTVSLPSSPFRTKYRKGDAGEDAVTSLQHTQ